MKNTEEKTKKRWENRSMVFGIVSILSCMCSLPTSGVPLGIPLGIFAIAFAIILFVVVQLKDQRILNQFRPEQIKVIQDYIQMYIAH